MAFTDDKPETYFPGYLLVELSDGGTLEAADTVATIGMDAAWITANLSGTQGAIVIPIDQLDGHVDTEANEVSGSWRKVVRALVGAMWSAYNAMAAADRPTKLTASRGSLVENGATESDRTYSLKFTLDSSALEVADE